MLLWAVSYFHVETVAKLLGLCLLGEIAVLMIFSFAVVVKGGGPDGMVWQALNPASLFPGGEGFEGAARVFGAGLAGIGFFFAFWSWVGFEMAPNYAEEARNPKRMMAAAIYISCLGLGLFYTFWAWTLVSAYGSTGDAWVWGVATSFGVEGAPAGVIPDPATHNYANVFYPVVHGLRRRGRQEPVPGAGHYRHLRVLPGVLEHRVPLPVRDEQGGILPRVLDRTHAERKSPFVAAFVMLAFTLTVYSLSPSGQPRAGRSRRSACSGATHSSGSASSPPGCRSRGT